MYKRYTYDDLMRLFKKSKYTTRLYIDRFAIIKKREVRNGKTMMTYLLDNAKIKEIQMFFKYK